MRAFSVVETALHDLARLLTVAYQLARRSLATGEAGGRRAMRLGSSCLGVTRWVLIESVRAGRVLRLSEAAAGLIGSAGDGR